MQHNRCTANAVAVDDDDNDDMTSSEKGYGVLLYAGRGRHHRQFIGSKSKHGTEPHGTALAVLTLTAREKLISVC